MGIKGIYGEIGPGDRISLSKLAINKLEKEGRPLRVAIDVSIWQFQTLAGQGGSNPAIRTFYYRLLRLLSFSVQPLFVFDGPNKPPFKRGKKTGHHGACVPNMMTKSMLKLFGFPSHTAPGEAEAECALLQREGLVDAVLSEDVDTLMFGCGLTFRNWSSEGTRGNKSPTHVSVYDAKKTKDGKSGLDREGMVLVALMSGGDYITEGIPHCGIKVACEAARAGFGKSLCKLANNDTAGLAAWRNNLAHEIRTNASGYFRIKHKTLTIPDKFPNREVLGYYTNPVVSSASKVGKLRDDIVWDGEIDVPGLRNFVAEAFDWTNKAGARKFIRNLAPALLVHKLRLRSDRRDSGYGDLVLTAMNEMELVRAICGNRNHFSVDCIRELRVVYCPIDIVDIDLDAEHDDSVDYSRSGLATNDADDQDLDVSDGDAPKSPSKRAPSAYDPTQPDKLWIPATIAKLGVPLKSEDYEESLKDPKKFMKAKFAAKRAATKGKTQKGDMDKFVSATKPIQEDGRSRTTRSSKDSAYDEPELPPAYLAPSLESQTFSHSMPATKIGRTTSTKPSTRKSTESDASRPTKTTTKSRVRSIAAAKPQANTNPWTLAQSGSSQNVPKVTKRTIITLPSSSPIAVYKATSPCFLSSSPPPMRSPTPTPTPLSARSPNLAINTSSGKKHHHSPYHSPIESPIASPAPSEPKFELPDTVTISRSRSRRAPKSQEPSTPSRSKNADHPSPRKKISPDHAVSIRSFQKSRVDSMSPQPVERMIDFSTSTSESLTTTAESEYGMSTLKTSITSEYSGYDLNTTNAINESDRDRSSSPEFPSLAELRSSASISIQSSRPTTAESSSQLEVMMKKKKRYIMPRKSMAGAWKEVDEDEVFGEGEGKEKEVGGQRKWRYSEVEVVDLTGDA